MSQTPKKIMQYGRAGGIHLLYRNVAMSRMSHDVHGFAISPCSTSRDAIYLDFRTCRASS